MATNLYLGVDGTARHIKSLYFGAVTDCPIYEEQTTNEAVNRSNSSKYFSTSGGSWGTSGYSLSACNDTERLTLLKDCSLSFSYRFDSTPVDDDDAFVSFYVSGTRLLNNVNSSGKKTWSGSLKAGDILRIEIVSSYGVAQGDFNLTDINITTTASVQVGTETKEAARKIKKVCIGVDGVARLCYVDSGS